jgi:hypothetical protein
MLLGDWKSAPTESSKRNVDFAMEQSHQLFPEADLESMVSQRQYGLAFL